MAVADNIKIKDFAIVIRRGNNQLQGRENNRLYEIYYKGSYVNTAYTKVEAVKWIRAKVKKANAILNKAIKGIKR